MKPWQTLIVVAVSAFCTSWAALVSSDVTIELRAISAVVAAAIVAGIAAAWPTVTARLRKPEQP